VPGSSDTAKQQRPARPVVGYATDDRVPISESELRSADHHVTKDTGSAPRARGIVASPGVTPTQLNMTVKNATTMRAPGINGITILNIVILVVLALLVSNKVSQDHKSQMDSAVRASNRLVRAVAAKRDMVKDQRLASDGRVVFEVQPKYTASAPALPGRFE